HEVQREDELTIALAGFVGRHDVGMVELRGQPGLALEASAEARVRRVLGNDQLERDGSIDANLRRPVDEPHPTTSDHCFDSIAAENRSDGELLDHPSVYIRGKLVSSAG